MSDHSDRLDDKKLEAILLIGVTAVIAGYFSIWLPGPAAGLQFIGLEMGEWVKFMGVDMSRNMFYLPPITVGMMLSLLSATWPNRRWQTWIVRGVAIMISTLAFPAWEDLNGLFRAEYMPRIWFIVVVIITTMFATVISSRRNRPLMSITPWFLLATISILGLFFPTWIYNAVLPVAENWLQKPLGVGLGVWLNGMGHLLVTAVSLLKLGKIPAVESFTSV